MATFAFSSRKRNCFKCRVSIDMISGVYITASSRRVNPAHRVILCRKCGKAVHDAIIGIPDRSMESLAPNPLSKQTKRKMENMKDM